MVAILGPEEESLIERLRSGDQSAMGQGIALLQRLQQGYRDLANVEPREQGLTLLRNVLGGGAGLAGDAIGSAASTIGNAPLPGPGGNVGGYFGIAGEFLNDPAAGPLRGLNREVMGRSQIEKELAVAQAQYDDLVRRFDEGDQSVAPELDALEAQMNAYRTGARPGGAPVSALLGVYEAAKRDPNYQAEDTKAALLQGLVAVALAPSLGSLGRTDLLRNALAGVVDPGGQGVGAGLEGAIRGSTALGRLLRGVEPAGTRAGIVVETGARVSAVPAEGYTRLYRVELARTPDSLPDWLQQGLKGKGVTDARGRWFTDKPDLLDWYRDDAGPNARTVYVDVPTQELEGYRVSNAPEAVSRFSKDPANEFFLPRNLADATRETPEAATEPASRYYHGTSVDFREPDPGRFDPNGLYGPGYYMTDNPEVAGSYAKQRNVLHGGNATGDIRRWRQELGQINTELETQDYPNALKEHLRNAIIPELEAKIADAEQVLMPGPNIRPINVPKDVKLLDISGDFMEPGTYKKLEDIVGYMPAGPNGTPERVYESLLAKAGGDRQLANRTLAWAGYDGIRYPGGQLTPITDAAGKPVEHDAVVIFPESLPKIRNALSPDVHGLLPTQGAPLAPAARRSALQGAVVGGYQASEQPDATPEQAAATAVLGAVTGGAIGAGSRALRGALTKEGETARLALAARRLDPEAQKAAGQGSLDFDGAARAAEITPTVPPVVPASLTPASSEVELTATRLGDFYEFFGDDAKIASDILGTTLTKDRSGRPVTGIPYFAVEKYQKQLADQGVKLNIIEKGAPQSPTAAELTERIRELSARLTPEAIQDAAPNLRDFVGANGKADMVAYDKAIADHQANIAALKAEREVLAVRRNELRAGSVLAPPASVAPAAAPPVEPPRPPDTASSEHPILSKWADTPAPAGLSRARVTKSMSKDLDELDNAGYEISEARTALEDYQGVKRADYERGADGTEDFHADAEEAWNNVLDAVQGAERTEDLTPPSIPPRPSPPAIAKQITNLGERAEQLIGGITPIKDAHNAAWIGPSGKLIGDLADHQESAVSTLKALGAPARDEYSAVKELQARTGIVRLSISENDVNVDLGGPITQKQVQAVRSLVARNRGGEFHYDVTDPASGQLVASGSDIDSFVRDAAPAATLQGAPAPTQFRPAYHVSVEGADAPHVPAKAAMKVGVPGLEGVETFAAKDAKGQWVVSDARSGLALSDPAWTRAEAVKQAAERVAAMGRENYDRAVESAVRRYGEAPGWRSQAAVTEPTQAPPEAGSVQGGQ